MKCVLKLKVFDYLVPKQEPSGYFTILNITEEDINNEGGWPIPRKRLGDIHKEIIPRLRYLEKMKKEMGSNAGTPSTV